MNTTSTTHSLDGVITIKRDPLQFTKREIWENCTEPFSSTSFWIQSMRTDADNVITISFSNPMNGDTLSDVLTPDQIVEAFRTAVRLGLTHCSGYEIQDLENADACTSDTILQIALFGELVFG